MYQITPYLYLSAAHSASTQRILDTHNITHIINLTAEHPNYFPTSYTYLRIPARDTLHERLSPFFPHITSFVASARDANGVALIHCAEGISRSVTGVLAALMTLERMRLGDALAYVRKVNPLAEPNRAFLRELRGLEARLWEGEWTREKLTLVDDGRAPRTLGDGEWEWREEVLDVLAAAAMGEEGVEAGGWSGDLVLEKGKKAAMVAVEGGKGNNGRSVEERLMELVTVGLENYGGRNEKDVRARQMLKSMVLSLAGDVFKSNMDLARSLRSMKQTEDWRELKIDVPVAESWINEILHGIEASHDDGADAKVVDMQGPRKRKTQEVQ
jgi:predicted protein tyrosine phosphatase